MTAPVPGISSSWSPAAESPSFGGWNNHKTDGKTIILNAGNSDLEDTASSAFKGGWSDASTTQTSKGESGFSFDLPHSQEPAPEPDQVRSIWLNKGNVRDKEFHATTSIDPFSSVKEEAQASMEDEDRPKQQFSDGDFVSAFSNPESDSTGFDSSSSFGSLSGWATGPTEPSNFGGFMEDNFADQQAAQDYHQDFADFGGITSAFADIDGSFGTASFTDPSSAVAASDSADIGGSFGSAFSGSMFSSDTSNSFGSTHQTQKQ